LLETDYFLLHEIARHGVHVSETLSVAIRSLDAMQHHHERFRANSDLAGSKNGRRGWDKVGNRFEFQLGLLQGLLQRSEANNARIQNEITLVGPVYDLQYAFVSEAYETRLSMLLHRGTARCSCRWERRRRERRRR
jgi:hypothetical protein